jgi:hypothetical protein
LPPGLNAKLSVTDVSGLAGADRAAIATYNTTISGQAVGISAIYVLKGAIFFTFSDLVVGQAAPASAISGLRNRRSLKASAPSATPE